MSASADKLVMMANQIARFFTPQRDGDPPRLVAAAQKAYTELGWKPQYPRLEQIVETAERDFYDAMDDDLNVPRALGSLFVFVRELNAALDAGVAPALKKAALRALNMMVAETLGLTIEKIETVAVDDELKKL